MNVESRLGGIQRRIKDERPESKEAATEGMGNMSDEKFMRQALSLAENALAAGEFPVGCVFVFEDRVVAQGSRIGSAGTAMNEIDHAEIIALREFYQRPFSLDSNKISVYCTLEPCLMCYAALVIAGVGKIVFAYEDAMGGGTNCRIEHLSSYYRDRLPVLAPYVLRDESLKLFQAFFRNPETDYLKGTCLAAYTLAQRIGAQGPTGSSALI